MMKCFHCHSHCTIAVACMKGRKWRHLVLVNCLLETANSLPKNDVMAELCSDVLKMAYCTVEVNLD
jgi:hypothetical protein